MPPIIGSLVRVRHTGDTHIDQYAGQQGRIDDTRVINDCGHQYTQVLIVLASGDRVWVNENEYDILGGST